MTSPEMVNGNGSDQMVARRVLDRLLNPPEHLSVNSLMGAVQSYIHEYRCSPDKIVANAKLRTELHNLLSSAVGFYGAPISQDNLWGIQFAGISLVFDDSVPHGEIHITGNLPRHTHVLRVRT